MGGGAVQVRIPGPIPDGLTVFETMRMEPDGTVRLWHLHMDRLRAGCAALGFPMPQGPRLDGVPPGSVRRVRLAVDAGGGVGITHAPLPPNPASWRVALRGEVESGDPWLRIKSSRRAVYDAARAALPAGVDEAILVNERGELCEGAITSLFVEEGDAWLTPALGCGLLPGVLRRSLLEAGRAREAVLRPADLRGRRVWMGNALRGLIPAEMVE